MQDKVIVLTGASSGIGAAVAPMLAEAGGRVVLSARRVPELEQVASKCGPNAHVVGADVAKRSEVTRVFSEAVARFGRVDVWINNAGRAISRPVSALTDEDFDEMMAVNAKSALYGMQAVLPHYRERGTGHIINISSLLGRVPLASFRSAYCASKHALNALTACLRLELRAEFPNIHVTTVSPGVVATDFGKSALHGGIDSRAIPGAQSAEEVARVIVDVIEKPRADVYTREGVREMIAAYYSATDMGDVESRPPYTMPRR